MKTTAQITKVAVFCLLATICASQASAQEPSLETLVSLSQKAATANSARDELRRLRDQDPADARVPYVYSLVLVDRLEYADALSHVRQATSLNPGNLNAWKMRIWLSVSTKDVNDALSSMQQLTSRMPRSASPAGEQVCQQFSGFMGKVFGYLAGPHAEKVSTMQVASVERRILGQLTPEREARSRHEQLAGLADEHNYAHNELQKIELTANSPETGWLVPPSALAPPFFRRGKGAFTEEHRDNSLLLALCATMSSAAIYSRVF